MNIWTAIIGGALAGKGAASLFNSFTELNSPQEGVLYLKRLFNKTTDHKFSDTEILQALDHISEIPEGQSRTNLLEALANLRKDSLGK